MPEAAPPIPDARVTVAIPVRNGGELLAEVLRSLACQTVAHELLVCDSGSSDGSPELARAHGARLIEIAPESFGHGRTRNLLMQEASGSHVAFLTQDAVPAGERWLECLLGGFSLAEDVAVSFGPYRARPGASLLVRLELESWFASLAPDQAPRLDRLTAAESALDAVSLMGRRGFLSDANACLARAAWERVPFRDVAYAEDRALALDLLRAGYAKAYVPEAMVVHSHDYTPLQQLRRSFDESRALLEIYGWREPVTLRHLLGQLRGAAGQVNRELARDGVPRAARVGPLARTGADRAARLGGSILGSRAERLPARARRVLSLERRSGVPPRRPEAHPEGTSSR
ncbi:MAG TPA: glycosyltransferase [Solirubrobacteraceae bacterium]|nr:glycosyltransferase [Solirubrobacteraceae bacterium]